MAQSKQRGCFPALDSVRQNLDEKGPERVKALLQLQYLRSRRTPLLGLTEPTMVSIDQRRLQEVSPNNPELTGILDPATITAQHMDYSQVQLKLDPQLDRLELPKIVQFEFLWLTEALPQSRSNAANDTTYNFFFREVAEEVMLEQMQFWSEAGAVITAVWHNFNPLHGEKTLEEIAKNPFERTKESGEKATIQSLMQFLNSDLDTIPDLSPTAKAAILTHRKKLNRIIAFANKAAAKGITILFRPYHEHSGHWFWWGLGTMSTNSKEKHRLFSELWVNTRAYLEAAGVDNFLYVYSPDIPDHPTNSKSSFMTHYQAGLVFDQVDILGLDFYIDKRLTHPFHSVEMDRASEECLRYLQWIKESFPNTAVGLTEIGLRYGELQLEPKDKTDGSHFWRDHFLPKLKAMPSSFRLAFMILWRNSPGDYIHPHANSDANFLGEVTALNTAFDTISWPINEVV